MINYILKKVIRRIRGQVDVEDLKKCGMKVGENFYKDAKAIIDPSWCWLVEIGNNVTLAPNVHILAHDASTKYKLVYTKIGTVNIKDNVFIGANTIVLPNVTIGEDSIIGAHSIVTHDIPPNSLAFGVPARVVVKAEDYINKQKEKMEESDTPIYDESFTLLGCISDSKKIQMKEELKKRIGFVK